MDIRQLKLIQQNFLKELQDASKGKKTSLPFIIHDLSPSPIVKNGEVFQVFVVGGTVGKVAILKKTKNGIRILKKKDEKLEFKEEEDFLSFINNELFDQTKVLALNFAYPIKPVFEKGRLDGILLAVTKEGSFHGLVGKKIGEEIEKYVLAKRNKRIKVAVANDTVCLLTSGLSKFEEEELAAGIVGTGLNFAFFLREEKLVNLESANFDKFPQSEEGKLIDQKSARPGKALFEKETAGAYLYKHFNIVIQERRIDYSQISSTEELNTLCHLESQGVMPNLFRHLNIPKNKTLKQVQGDNNGQVQHDRDKISEIAQNLIQRSAQLVACQIAGITEFKKQNMVFNMEGSLFWKGNNYKETVRATVKQLMPDYKFGFVGIEESAILGAANLVS